MFSVRILWHKIGLNLHLLCAGLLPKDFGGLGVLNGKGEILTSPFLPLRGILILADWTGAIRQLRARPLLPAQLPPQPWEPSAEKALLRKD